MRARRPWAWPLVPLYAAAVGVKDGLRALGLVRTRRLQWPVVSVGSLSAGGAGKTPVVIALAELLKGQGRYVDVLSRGYGRDRREQPHDSHAARGDHGAPGVERVDVEAEGAARRFGDEPVLIARRAGVPVWVGAERFAAGVAAERSFDAHDFDWTEDQVAAINVGCVHLLDDGFQHRGLARAMDVVVVTAEDLEDAMLPAGNRRERLGALGRADAVVVREEELALVAPGLQGHVRGDAVIWVVRREISFPEVAPVVGSGAAEGRDVVFCAIARPANFVEMLREAGVHEPEVVPFPDHHAYTLEDMDRLAEVCGRAGGRGFITTEKDAVKLSPEMRARLEAAGPLAVARLDCRFVDEAEVTRALEARLS